jgi:hypothetical protein|tara:strand:+ start:11306 stop:13282 length:1977 start_codon:yes stop_codon:yes gene_type:complete
MSRVIDIQNSFTSGELDPKLIARDDIKAYDAGLTTALNVVVLPQGGVKRRPGLKYITELGGSPENGIRLVSFEFNTSDAYLLAFTNLRMYVIKNGVLQTNIAGSGNDYLTTTITSAQLSEMCWVQSADTLIVVQEDMVPKKITRTSDTAWTITDVTFVFNPQHAFTLTIENTSSAGTLTPSGTEGKITLTTQHSYWASDDVGSYVNVIGSNQFGRARIVAVDSASVAQALVEIPFFNTDALANSDWEHETGYEDTFSGSRGYPRTATFHQGRLYFGGSKSRPSTIFASRVNAFFDFNPGEGLDDDGFTATLDTNQLNTITDVLSANYLQIFTTGGEFFAPQDFSDPLTPTNFIAKIQSSHGSKENIRVQNITGSTIYVQRQGKALNEFIYDRGGDGYLTSQISLLSSHLLNTPVDMSIRRATSTDEGDRLVVVNNDASCAVYTLLKDQNIVAATKFTTDGDFLNVATVVSDQYVAVKRTINSVNKYYIELFDEAFTLDSGVSGGAASSHSSGHLNQKTVKVIGDGVMQADVTAGSSAITFASATSTSYQAGLDYTVTIKTLPIEPGIQGYASLKGFKKRVLEVNAFLNETQNLTINGNNIPIRTFGTSNLDVAVPEFTGTKTLHGILGYSLTGQITIGQSAPLKLHLLGMDYKVSTGG